MSGGSERTSGVLMTLPVRDGGRDSRPFIEALTVSSLFVDLCADVGDGLGEARWDDDRYSCGSGTEIRPVSCS